MLTENNQTRQVQSYPLVTKLLIAYGAIGPILFILVFLVEGATRPGYSAWRNFVSDLGESKLGWMQDINFLSLTIAIFVLALRFASDPAWRGWGRYSVISGILLMGFFIACVYVSGLDQKGVLPNSPTGFFERIAIFVGWTWLALVALKLLRQMRSPVSPAQFAGKAPDATQFQTLARATGHEVITE